MSEIGQRQESILLLDLGTCTTKAVLLDVVEGQYGLVATAQAPSTARDPWQNLSYGAVEAISRLEEICGRTLLGEAEPDDADGAAPVERHGASGRPGPIDQRLITPKFWRDVYQYNKENEPAGWIRYSEDGKTEFNRDGLIVLEKDFKGRCTKGRTVEYSQDPPQRDRKGRPPYVNTSQLKQNPGKEIWYYKYDDDSDWQGKVVKIEKI